MAHIKDEILDIIHCNKHLNKNYNKDLRSYLDGMFSRATMVRYINGELRKKETLLQNHSNLEKLQHALVKFGYTQYDGNLTKLLDKGTVKSFVPA